MTRPRADTDPWLTDMVSRDREVAKAVVYGIRDIQGLLRSIRDVMVEENGVLLRENNRLRQELVSAYRGSLDGEDGGSRLGPGGGYEPSLFDHRPKDFPPCEKAGCSLPQGHDDPHRGTMRDMNPRRASAGRGGGA